ncbi:unnamed protein product [Brassica oleracea var. botrytis]
MGCIISKKKSPKRNNLHHQSSSEKRSSRINSSSQSKDEQQDKSKYRDAKVRLIEPESFSSARFSEKHPEIPEIGDTDDEEKELKREPDVQVACLASLSGG